MALEIKIEKSNDEAVVEVSGDVNIHTSNDLRKALKPLFAGKLKQISIKLHNVDFMDSSGIATLVEGLQWSKASSGKFILSGLSENVRDVFELAKLDTIFEIQD